MDSSSGLAASAMELPLEDPPAPGATHENVVAHLTRLYSKSATGFGSDYACCNDAIDVCNMQYGEVTYAGMEPLYAALRLKHDDVFYDLGSGVGKLVLYVALRGEVSKAVGLEVGERRHRLASSACDQLTKELEAEETQLPCSKFAAVQADISRERYHDATVVVLTNLCMDMQVQSRTLDQLMKCPTMRRLACITPMFPHLRLKLNRMVHVACTWAKISSWHIYDVLPAPPPRAGLLRSSILWRPPTLGTRSSRQLPKSASVSRSSSSPALASLQGATADSNAPKLLDDACASLPSLHRKKTKRRAKSTTQPSVGRAAAAVRNTSAPCLQSFCPDSDCEIKVS